MKSGQDAAFVKSELRSLIMLCHFGIVVAFMLTQMLSTLYFVAKDYQRMLIAFAADLFCSIVLWLILDLKENIKTSLVNDDAPILALDVSQNRLPAIS